VVGLRTSVVWGHRAAVLSRTASVKTVVFLEGPEVGLWLKRVDVEAEGTIDPLHTPPSRT